MRSPAGRAGQSLERWTERSIAGRTAPEPHPSGTRAHRPPALTESNGRPAKSVCAGIAPHCPWPCLDQHITLADATGRAQATMCLLCGQALTRADWQAELDAAHARSHAEDES